MNRTSIVTQMQKWVGIKAGTTAHKGILSIYNSYKPLPRGYTMKVPDAWCAATVSAASINCGYTSIIPPECSCGKMIDLLKNLNEWQEDDAYVPMPGDLIFYYWSDDGVGDCNCNHASHVGIVESCDGTYIHTIEGNYSNQVKRRTIKVNSRYIRGFGIPKYDEADNNMYVIAKKGDTVSKYVKDYGSSKTQIIAWNNLKAPYWLITGRKYRVK